MKTKYHNPEKPGKVFDDKKSAMAKAEAPKAKVTSKAKAVVKD